MDLGSGVGKFVAQSYLEWPAVVCAVGIELEEIRAERATAAWEAMVLDGRADDVRRQALDLVRPGGARCVAAATDSVSLIQGDMLRAEVGEATHIFVSSLCFSTGVLARLVRKLSSEATNLKVVATLREFPCELPGFALAKRIEADMSWTADGASVYIYERHAVDAPPYRG
mmetsp:Transcript_11925/g.42663  ORF Transcript_11925/g.42663 Transcript_11925/m.42663 type:complete len:171 (+) Transcript_11925:87-599(+)